MKCSLGENQLTSNGMKLLLNHLNDKELKIKKLYLFRNPFDDDCISYLGDFIKKSLYIELVDISGDGKSKQLTDTGIAVLVPYLDENATLKTIAMRGQKGITKSSVPKLLSMIEKSSIECLELSGTSANDVDILPVPLTLNAIKNGSEKIDLNWK